MIQISAGAQTNPVETYPGYNFEGVNPSYLSQTVEVHSQTPPFVPFPPYFLQPVVALESLDK